VGLQRQMLLRWRKLQSGLWTSMSSTSLTDSTYARKQLTHDAKCLRFSSTTLVCPSKLLVISRTLDPISHPYCHHPFYCACYTSVGSALLPPSIIRLDIQPSGHCSQPVPLTPESSDLRTSGTCPDISGPLSRTSHPDFRTYIGFSPMSRSISNPIR
jgi:hypothetical protein